MKKERTATVLLLLLSIFVLIGFVPIRISFLEERAGEITRNAGADSVQIEKVTMKLWQGLRVSGLKTVKNLEAEKKYVFSASEVDISCNLITTAFAFLVSDKFSLEGDLFRKAYEKPSDMIIMLTEVFSSFGTCRKVSVNGGTFDLFGKNQNGFFARNISLELHKGKSAKAFKGEVNISKVHIPAIAEVESFSGKLSIKNNQLLLQTGRGNLFSGKLRCETGIDLLSSELLSSEVTVDKLELEQFCTKSGFSLGELRGKVSLEATIEPGFIHLDSLKGKGNLHVSKANAVNLPVQKSITVNFVSPKLTDLYFKTVKSDFKIEGGRLNFGNFYGKGDIMDFNAHGWIRHDGRMNLRMEGFFSSEFSEELKRLVRFSLEKTDEGKRRFKCKIKGTFEYPQIEIDGSIYQRAAGNILGNMKQGLKSIFK